jgi:hypothetical protein
MSPANTRTIIGLVDALGSGGASDGQSNQWSLVFHWAGWRHPGSEVATGKRRCELPVSKDDLRSLMDLVGPYSVVEVELDEESTAEVTKLRRIVDGGAKDPELEQLALELQKPIVLNDATLGRLEYDRKYGWYAGRAQWCGQAVNIRLSCTRPEDASAVSEAAARLFKEQQHWHRRVQQYAVERLLPLKNGSWLDEEEEEISAAEFLSKMRLESISVDESGDFTFWHDDGDLFWGHAIQMRGNFTEGLTRADLPG